MSEVLLERPEEGVVLLTVNRPDVRNALNTAVREALSRHFVEFAADDSVRAVVVTGAGGNFVAGADIKELAETGTGAMMARGVERMWTPLRNFPKPLIAAVNGFALGGGCELAMHADIILAGESAEFGQPEINLGIIPGAGGTQRLTRAVGKFKAMELLLAGRRIPAGEADAMGLVTRVLPDAEVLPEAIKLAKRIARMPPLAARKIKEVVLAGQDQSLETALLLERNAFMTLLDTEDKREGVAAFLEKRKPEFKGR